MTKRDFQLALIRGYLQTPETQTDFLLAEAEKFKVNPMNFYMGLLKAYKDFEQYLNSSDGRAWNKNDKGERVYIKNSLNLSDFTNEEFSGNIFSSNLPGIKKVIYKFVVTVLKKVEQEDSQQIKGFQTSLFDKQIESLYNQMQGDYFDTDMDNFKAIFKPEIKEGFTPIKRTKKFTNALLIYFTSELFQKENPSDYVSITEYCFSAKNLSKSQTNYFSYNKNHKPKGFEKIDSIIKTIYSRL